MPVRKTTDHPPAAPAARHRIVPELEITTPPRLKHDSPTNDLIRRYRKMKAEA